MKIGVVLVTYNRLEKLKIALSSFDQQFQTPAYMIVVDNASTDGTAELLAQWTKQPSSYPRTVITKQENTGGSGGFYTGLEAAVDRDADWIWLSDDDAFPEADALEKAAAFITEQADRTAEISAFCGAVINNGEVDLEHRRTLAIEGCRVAEYSCPVEEYQKPYFPLDVISYVGIIIHKPHLKRAGLTSKDFFIWFDDTEHSVRLGKTGKMYCVPAIRIHHDMPPQNNSLNWKVYYGRRNRLLTIKWNFPAKCYRFELLRLTKWAFADLLHKGERRIHGKLLLCAVKDALFEKQGLHSLYRPGWKPGD